MLAILSNDVARPPGSAVSRLLSIFHAPKQVFAEIDRGAPWWEPWIWVSALNMVVAYVAIPIQIRLYRLTAVDLSEEDLRRAIEGMQSVPIKAVAIIGAPVGALFAGVIFAAVSYIAVSVLSERANFKKHLAICLWASLVWWVGVLVSTLIVRARGVDQIRTVRDAVASFGPAALVPEAGKIPLAILSTLDVFALWFYGLVAVGVVSVFRVSWRNVALVVVPVWLLNVLFELISTSFSGMP